MNLEKGLNLDKILDWRVKMIQISNLTRCFGPLAAVQDLNVKVEAGELYGFLGPNGAGKTTTIRMIVGLLRPTAGRIVVVGHDVRQEPMIVKRSLGYLAQTPLLYERLTGREFLRFLGGLYNLEEEKIADRSEHLLTLMELDTKADQLIESYSGGMRHKIGLCGALLHEPPVIVLDEPLAGMDPLGARRIKDFLRELCRHGNTVFLSTHVLEVAERVCDRVGILNHGRLIAEGTMETLRAQAHSSTETTLEDLFIELTGGKTEVEMVSMLE
jgi:ABC-2 type transport system ATP-binding protein